VRRIIKVFDLLGSLFGLRPKKEMMVRILILRDEQGQPVVPQKEVERWVSVASTVYKDKCNVVIIRARLSEQTQREYVRDGISLPTTFPLVSVAAENAPTDALTVPGETSSAYNDELDYFRPLLSADYAKPTVTGFVIRDVSGGSRGFAWGMISDIFVVDPTALSTSVAHEIGHLCWLLHRKKKHNLMTPGRDDMDSHLTRWQIAMIRSSKYANYTNYGA
jgi:hypothetical protein